MTEKKPSDARDGADAHVDSVEGCEIRVGDDDDVDVDVELPRVLLPPPPPMAPMPAAPATPEAAGRERSDLPFRQPEDVDAVDPTSAYEGDGVDVRAQPPETELAMSLQVASPLAAPAAAPFPEVCKKATKPAYAVCREWVEETLRKSRQDLAEEYKKVKDDPEEKRLNIDAFVKAARELKRYPTMVVWDRTIVTLTDGEGGEFIHANYVSGPYTSHDFVLTQGPLPETLGDFWAMIWQEKVPIIVMLCQCQELVGKEKKERKTKSVQYWSESLGGVVKAGRGGLEVRTDGVRNIMDERLQETEIRLTELKLSRGRESRNVFHYQMRNWADMDVPPSALGLFRFQEHLREKERELRAQKQMWPSSPIVVHCSAGVGRSGTFVALLLARYVLLETIGDALQLPQFVRRLRRERHGAVQTEAQYVFLYTALLCLLKDQGLVPLDADLAYAPEQTPAQPALAPPPVPRRVKAKPRTPTAPKTATVPGDGQSGARGGGPPPRGPRFVHLRTVPKTPRAANLKNKFNSAQHKKTANNKTKTRSLLTPKTPTKPTS